ncbi:hypothetical protein W02_05060 [Nitrospira sp. KM1]|nr:hypothetical protein W02_05060 [Nitrospira sp. KM1]
MQIRGCPAAVSENDSTFALTRQSWEAVESRNAAYADTLASPKTCQHPAPERQPVPVRP